jgi:hypothetical protein
MLAGFLFLGSLLTATAYADTGEGDGGLGNVGDLARPVSETVDSDRSEARAAAGSDGSGSSKDSDGARGDAGESPLDGESRADARAAVDVFERSVEQATAETEAQTSPHEAVSSRGEAEGRAGKAFEGAAEAAHPITEPVLDLLTEAAGAVPDDGTERTGPVLDIVGNATETAGQPTGDAMAPLSEGVVDDIVAAATEASASVLGPVATKLPELGAGAPDFEPVLALVVDTAPAARGEATGAVAPVGSRAARTIHASVHTAPTSSPFALVEPAPTAAPSAGAGHHTASGSSAFTPLAAGDAMRTAAAPAPTSSLPTGPVAPAALAPALPHPPSAPSDGHAPTFLQAVLGDRPAALAVIGALALATTARRLTWWYPEVPVGPG